MEKFRKIFTWKTACIAMAVAMVALLTCGFSRTTVGVKVETKVVNMSGHYYAIAVSSSGGVAISHDKYMCNTCKSRKD